MKFTENLILKLKRDLKSKKAEAMEFIKDSFGDMFDDKDFLSWLSKKLEYKPNQLKSLLQDKAHNIRKLLQPKTYQDVYDFWLQNSLNSNDSQSNVVNITKRAFLEQYNSITDANLMEKEVTPKSGTKKIFFAGKKIYTHSLRALHNKFNCTHEENVSSSTFYSYKPHYVCKPTEKEKELCLCIDCLNPHQLLKSINMYQKSVGLPEYESLTTYVNEIKANGEMLDLFPETKAENEICFYSYERKTESYKGKDGQDVHYTRTARVDKKEKLSVVVDNLLQISSCYLKHRSYVGNVNIVLPMLKEGFSGKCIELDFLENLDLRPKHKAQSVQFSRKQHTLHCAIFRPGDTIFHYHLSDDTKHDFVFVEEFLRDLIRQYDIKNEDVMIQSDNVPTHYKNRHSFALLQNLANEFNLRIIRTYGVAGHGKGTIDAMSSFGVKNVLRRDIVTQDVFFDSSKEIVEYLQI